MGLLKTAALAAAICIVGTAAVADSQAVRPMFKVFPTTGHIAVPGRPTVSPLPSFTYTVHDPVGHKQYTGMILGSDPASLTATTLPVQIIPLNMILTDSSHTTVVYDPTAQDPCNNNIPATKYVARSPLFASSVKWTMNGVHIGKSQYIDAFQRAEFWNVVHGSNYHLNFSLTQLPKQRVKLGPDSTGNVSGGPLCGYAGQTGMAMVDNAVRAIMAGPLASSINPGTLPVFLLHNVFMTDTGCCVLGYHDSLTVNGQLQVYAVADVDSSHFFDSSGDPDTVTLSHELAEAVNDPTGGNQVPPWNNGHFCQPNLEVGDPIAGHDLPPITIAGPYYNATYHVQELAYFGWFFHRLGGAGRDYSDNGTFTTYAPQCP